MSSINLKKPVTFCSSPVGYGTFYCNSGHVKEDVPFRCRRCKGCLEFRRLEWSASAQNRLRVIGKKVWKVNLWTLGTNFKLRSFIGYGGFDENLPFPFHKEIYQDNILLIKRWFTLWRKRIYINQSRKKVKGNFRPLMYSVEVGSSGYLHIHFISAGFLPHEVGRHTWEQVTNIHNPNVGYSPSRRRKPIQAFRYASKYIMKNLGEFRFQRMWYWLGEFIKSPPSARKTYTCFHKLFDGSLCGDYIYLILICINGLDETYNFAVLPIDRSSKQTRLKIDPNYATTEFELLTPPEYYYSS